VVAGRDRARRFLRAADQRDEHAGGAPVERPPDRGRLVGGHAHDRGRAGGGQRLQHRQQGIVADQAVLLVQAHEAEPDGSHDLRGGGTG
jgi:hypothetical protein